MKSTRAEPGVLPALDIGAARAPGSRDFGRVLQTWHDGEGRVVAHGGHDRGSWGMDWPGLGLFTFGPDGPVPVLPVVAGLDDRLRDSFTRGVIPVVLLSRGFEALHASAVNGPNGVVAICAASGTGKSTLALALAAEGLSHWADDTVVYHLAAGDVLSLQLPCVPRIADTPRDPAGKASASPAGCVRPVTRIYHLVRDECGDPRRPVFTPIHAEARFERLLAHAHPFDMGPEARRRAFITSLLDVSRTVDSWECRFAPALEELPSLARAVRIHIEQADACAAS